ncbi:hypothetical protein B0H16DRAFT_1799942 [Mycena metata]|uniref:Uncharacterized protein n=1 Tax=Mycena metata TaxID=1033252 RepID=A0AAD7JGN2_9AGAR|nr:hypothetical protein B0H16DRAFT_1799942 [Mycena metata]
METKRTLCVSEWEEMSGGDERREEGMREGKEDTNPLVCVWRGLWPRVPGRESRESVIANRAGKARRDPGKDPLPRPTRRETEHESPVAQDCDEAGQPRSAWGGGWGAKSGWKDGAGCQGSTASLPTLSSAGLPRASETQLTIEWVRGRHEPGLSRARRARLAGARERDALLMETKRTLCVSEWEEMSGGDERREEGMREGKEDTNPLVCVWRGLWPRVPGRESRESVIANRAGKARRDPGKDPLPRPTRRETEHESPVAQDCDEAGQPKRSIAPKAIARPAKRWRRTPHAERCDNEKKYMLMEMIELAPEKHARCDTRGRGRVRARTYKSAHAGMKPRKVRARGHEAPEEHARREGGANARRDCPRDVIVQERGEEGRDVIVRECGSGSRGARRDCPRRWEQNAQERDEQTARERERGGANTRHDCPRMKVGGERASARRDCPRKGRARDVIVRGRGGHKT